MTSYQELLNSEFMTQAVAGNPIRDYAIAFAILLFSVLVLRLFKLVLINRLKDLAKKTKSDIDDFFIKAIDSIGWLFYIFLALYISLQFITIHETVELAFYYILLILSGYYLIKIAGIVIEYGAKKAIEERKKEDKSYDSSTVTLLSNVLKVSMWVIVAILIISNLGYDVSALLAGLGIGGLAVALAAQTILADIFASFSLN